jgi:hypothetical protein
MHPIWWPGYAVKPLGELSQAIFTRRMASTAKEDVLAQLARDVATLQPWLVEIKRVSAIGSLGDGRSGANLSVQMTSAGGALAQWILEPAGDSPGATLSLRGAQNRWDFDLPASGPWRMQSEGKWHEATGDAEQAFVKFAAEILEQNIVDHLPGWLAACRATEVADTVPRCLARGKTIDLYNEEHTEEGAFKGVMAVGGCLILMLGLLAVVMVAVIEGLQLPLYRFSLWSNWPLYICAVFFFFLLLQLFRFAARGNGTRSSASKDPSDVGV